MPVLPFSRHIGPGNAILPEGSNEIDNIARAHDIAYDRASEASEIVEADEKFVNNLWDSAPRNYVETLQKYAGLIGISAKKGVEGVIGVQYPKMSKRARHDDEEESDMFETSIESSKSGDGGDDAWNGQSYQAPRPVAKPHGIGNQLAGGAGSSSKAGAERVTAKAVRKGAVVGGGGNGGLSTAGEGGGSAQAGIGLVSVPRSLISSGHLLSTNHVYTLQLRLFNPNKIVSLRAAGETALYSTWIAPLYNCTFAVQLYICTRRLVLQRW